MDNPGSILRRLFRSRPPGEPPPQEESEEYVEEITDRLTEQGYINPEEAGMIRRVVEFRDRTAAEIMVPRSEIFAISTAEPFQRVIEHIRDRSHSRIPFYDGDIDNVVGVLYTKDLLKLWGKPVGAHDHLKLLRPPLIVPEGKPATELMARFKADRMHLAIVIDEYGGLSGIVTLEDLIEEIFGEIQDEYDEEESLVNPLPDGAVLVDARLPVDRAFELLSLEEPEGEQDYDTLGGFLSNQVGRIPRRGEQIAWGGRTFVIESANSRRIFKVRALPPSEVRATAAESATPSSVPE